jgi:hypothetical protein
MNMNTRIGRVISVALTASAACAALAVAAPNAGALLWLVSEQALAQKSNLLETTAASAETLIELTSTLTGGAKVQIFCNALKLKEGEIIEKVEEVPTGLIKSIELSECKVNEPLTCTVTAAIDTNSLELSLFEETGGSIWEKIVATAAAREIALIAVSGCAGEGDYPLTGSACATMLIANSDAKEQLWEFGKPLSECGLSFGVNAATLTGELTGTVGSGAKWGADS